MRKISIFFVISLTLILNSCVIKNQPVNDLNYANITHIKELEGCYSNRSESESTYNILLSELLWKEEIEHEKIYTVCVKSLNSNELEVTGKNTKKILYRKIFTKDKDFTLESGKITILNKLGGINDNFAGITHESTVIGIDTEGNGKLTKTGSFVGVALLIPLAGHISDTYRFRKIR